MKKMLIMAMAVFALMACKKSSDTGLPKGEAKALETTTVGAIDQLGDSQDQVDAKLTKAGYKKINGGFNPLSAPARIAKKAPMAQNGSANVEVTYAYGLPDNYEKMSEAQAMAWLNDKLADGDAIMIVTATFKSDKLSAMATMFIIKKSSKANKSFTAISDDMYKQLPSGQGKHGWAAVIEDNETEKQTNYTDHSSFVSAVSKAEGITAEETGVAMYNGFSYANLWFNPNAADEKEMLEEGFDYPFCEGAYVVASYDSLD